MAHEKKIIRNERVGEEYTFVKHPSGLNIYIWKTKGFSTTDAYFGTKYGSINTRFKTADDDDFVDVPEGIAHFLEHKLFENEDCDVFDLYAKTGANANAYTSFDQTVYLFRCSSRYLESLEILLSFVQKPYFTQETVDKEQGIIGQEIKMCQDSPDRQGYFNLLKCLYVNHPVKVDIAGTVESIAQINADLLYRCYRTFYNLNNMVLCIAGDVDVDDILKVCDEQLIPCEDMKLETAFPEEPSGLALDEYVEKMTVAAPIFNIGFKCPTYKGIELLKKETEASIIMQLLMGTTSQLYKELIESGLINSQFATEVFCGDGFFSCICSGESKDPKAVMKRILEEVEKVRKTGFDKEQFDIIKKSKYGNFIRGFNNTEVCVSLLLNAEFSNVDVFDIVEVLAETTLEDVEEAFDELFDVSKAAISIIEPVQ